MLGIQMSIISMLLSEFDFLPICRADLAGSRTLLRPLFKIMKSTFFGTLILWTQPKLGTFLAKTTTVQYLNDGLSTSLGTFML